MQSIKLLAGHMLIYASIRLYLVNPVARGARLVAFFWRPSLLRDDAQHSIVFDMDTAIQKLNQTSGDVQAILQLTGCHHNPLRMWSNL